MRPLYRTRSAAATSNEGPLVVLIDAAASYCSERRAIEQLEDMIFPADSLAHVQTLERLVGMDERHSERVGDMLLRERKLGRALSHG